MKKEKRRDMEWYMTFWRFYLFYFFIYLSHESRCSDLLFYYVVAFYFTTFIYAAPAHKNPKGREEREDTEEKRKSFDKLFVEEIEFAAICLFYFILFCFILFYSFYFIFVISVYLRTMDAGPAHRTQSVAKKLKIRRKNVRVLISSL